MDTQKIVRRGLILWIGYFFILALIDWQDILRESGLMAYYVIQILNGVFILGVALLPWRRLWSEQTMLPAIIVLMAILPTVTPRIVNEFVRDGPGRPLLTPDATTLRLMPILLMGLLLVVWHYDWRKVVLFSVGTAAQNLIGFLAAPSLDLSTSQVPYKGAIVTIVQVVSLLMVGYFTSALVSRLRAQQRSLEEANAQLRDQASTQVELTISHERNRMARELHDTLAHTLSGLTVELQTVKAYWEIEPTTAQKLLDNALAATRSGLQETRSALKSLRATPLEDLGLLLALQQLAKAAAERANLNLQLSIPESLPPLAPKVTHCLYRIAQEAIMNVVYHAAAKTLAVNVTVHESGNGMEIGDWIQLGVRDDGIGFDPYQAHPNHWGLAGMRERAQLVGGNLLIESQIGDGTTVRLVIPKGVA